MIEQERIYMYMHAVTISEKEDHECKEVQGEVHCVFRKRKGKEELFHLSSKILIAKEKFI